MELELALFSAFHFHFRTGCCHTMSPRFEIIYFYCSTHALWDTVLLEDMYVKLSCYFSTSLHCKCLQGITGSLQVFPVVEKPCNIYRLWWNSIIISGVSLWFLLPFSIDSAGFPCRDPVVSSPRSFHGVKICSVLCNAQLCIEQFSHCCLVVCWVSSNRAMMAGHFIKCIAQLD